MRNCLSGKCKREDIFLGPGDSLFHRACNVAPFPHTHANAPGAVTDNHRSTKTEPPSPFYHARSTPHIQYTLIKFRLLLLLFPILLFSWSWHVSNLRFKNQNFKPPVRAPSAIFF